MRSKPRRQPPDSPGPLTHRTQTGELLQRDLDVEDQIRSALILPVDELLERAKISRKDDDRYLKEETLAYLIREYFKVKNKAVVSALWLELQTRCARYIKGRLGNFGPDAMEEGNQWVTTQLFEKIVAGSGDSGDYYQVRFWFGLKRLVTSAIRIQIEKNEEDRQILRPLSSVPGYEPEGGQEEEEETRTDSDRPKEKEDSAPSVERIALGREALLTLPEPLRTIYILRYEAEWQIESKDPHEMTISKYFGITPRTVRNKLKEAEEALEKWRGQPHDQPSRATNIGRRARRLRG